MMLSVGNPWGARDPISQNGFIAQHRQRLGIDPAVRRLGRGETNICETAGSTKVKCRPLRPWVAQDRIRGQTRAGAAAIVLPHDALVAAC